MTEKLYVKKKVIKDKCWGCPNMRHDRYDTLDYHSGIDCVADGSFRRIADDMAIDKYDAQLVKKAQGRGEVIMEDPMKIPEWCILEDCNGEGCEEHF